jgi:small subunit ribosomal protein S6
MAVAQVLKSKEYETIYILRSDVDADTADKVQGRVAEVVGRDNGKLVKVESWGRRKLAYPVGKQRKGVYIYVKYIGRGGLVQELERNLKLQDSVLKFQTVQTAEEINVETVTIDPEEVKFQRLELPAEEEEKESREKALGLVDFGDGPRSMRGDRGVEDDYADVSEAGDVVPGAAPAAPAAPVAAAAPAEPAAETKEAGTDEES